MKKEIKQNIKIALCGLITIALLVLTALELIPDKKSGIIVKEKVIVSSQLLDASSGQYTTTITGTLFNETTETIVVDALTVRVSDGKIEKDIPIDLSGAQSYRSLTVAPLMETEQFKETIVGGNDFNEVKEIRIIVQGELYTLSNVDEKTISIVAIILIAILLLFGFLLYRAILVRYYMHKEAQAGIKTEEKTEE